MIHTQCVHFVLQWTRYGTKSCRIGRNFVYMVMALRLPSIRTPRPSKMVQTGLRKALDRPPDKLKLARILQELAQGGSIGSDCHSKNLTKNSVYFVFLMFKLKDTRRERNIKSSHFIIHLHVFDPFSSWQELIEGHHFTKKLSFGI